MKLQRRTFRPDGTDVELNALQEALRPGSWVVEADCRPPPPHRPSRLLARLALPQAMAVSLRTTTVMCINLGTALIDRLEAADCTIGPLAGLALHEMLVNAAIHGNLHVASGQSAAWRDLATREQLIEAALNDPVCRARLVTVALGWDADRVCAAIIDQGAGYTRPDICAELPNDPRSAAGRGMIIARAAAHVDVLRGGCCTRLTFSRAPRVAN